MKKQTNQYIEDMLLQVPKDAQRTKSYAEQRRDTLKKRILDTKLAKSQKDRVFESQIPIKPKAEQKRLKVEVPQAVLDDPDHLCPPNQKLFFEKF